MIRFYLYAIVFNLGILIFVHELGHYIAARASGVRVERFSMGFGPRILKFTREGELVWDFDHRPPEGVTLEEDNTQTDILANKGRFQLDQDAREIYIINWKRVLVYDMDTGAYKRGWGGHGMRLSEITNDPIPPYEWDGGPPPEERQFVPDLHFIEISNDGPLSYRRPKTWQWLKQPGWISWRCANAASGP